MKETVVWNKIQGVLNAWTLGSRDAGRVAEHPDTGLEDEKIYKRLPLADPQAENERCSGQLAIRVLQVPL
jgi:hypothetical protein